MKAKTDPIFDIQENNTRYRGVIYVIKIMYLSQVKMYKYYSLLMINIINLIPRQNVETNLDPILFKQDHAYIHSTLRLAIPISILL